MRVRHVITVYVNRKPCMASPTTSSHVTLSDLERSNSRSLTFKSLIPGNLFYLSISNASQQLSKFMIEACLLAPKPYLSAPVHVC